MTHRYLDPQAPRKSLTSYNVHRVTATMRFRSTSSAKELDLTLNHSSVIIKEFRSTSSAKELDPTAPPTRLLPKLFRSTSSAKELDTGSPLYCHMPQDLDPQAPRKSLTARFVINHSECNKKYYLHLIIYRTFIVNCYILF